MASTFENFIQSHQFTFFVGQEGKSIVVHAAAITATSQQLDALINGGMGESETRCARIEDVKVDDFIRFCEYAYRGDYTVPPWEELPPEPSSTSGKDQQNGDDDGWGDWAPLPKKKKGKKGRVAVPEPEPIPESELPSMEMGYPQESGVYDEPELAAAPEPQYEVRRISRAQLRTQLNSRNYLNDGGPKALILQHFEPKSNSAVDQNFTPVLLAHARLYCFAHLRLIEPLKALTLDKLHKTLMDFKLYTKRVGDIIELARYAYSNPDLPDRSDDRTLDDLRKLVFEYIVCEIDTIGKCDEFVKYMEEGGEFVGDFWRMARDYMA
ncbi:uncharacterized protein BDZ99DRAFT_482433 [Mytilinidion resinicola]|uniref:BTB domain-containing protein n=1 Tax=Mytilinidion resinicola TaxID=574789 RepID=A0A6A6Y218_9PEZI|nr:uncharacterized protein BDZ99DRAFT_482433 [Mytilinidion resinicola]KAF2802861.1 hypothetical protein BDZ99DRAFT_482433 [Mytilinidion resinicola]